ncbi:MAG: endonuclease MutS2 [Oscillospiraceae bacterium]|nr:endonuclease MutS2 [Oscillospiraceae bacterium]
MASSLFEKSIRVLELPRVLEWLSRHAVSEAAKERARALSPATELDEVRRLLDETDAARDMIVRRGSPSFAGVKSVSEALGRAERGGTLNPRELLDVAGLLTAARRAREYLPDDAEPSVLDRLFASLRPNRYLEDKITTAIVSEDEIADAASTELADIRRHKRAAAAKGRQILQKIISSPSYKSVLQESLITQRGGRFVVPVKAEFRGELPGLVHDTSSSGATLFIEPMGVVQANNELKELEAREEKEIDRILAALSAEAAGFAEDVAWNYDLLVHLDLIFARGELSCEMDAARPDVRADGGVYLRRARHPLLERAKAVPIDVELGRGFDTLVITGPNTGGKTVSLKTLGLLCLMTQCGLHIPCADRSAVSIFSAVLADIGDEQSIEQSLSTFSAHMTNIVQILDEADGGSLILFDELGAGTDPVEGAALAIAVIQEARARGAKVAATTHYAELKTFAMTTAGVENASCEFDVETLAPTYRLLIGIPGKSNAFAISARLGLPERVIARAREQMSGESVRFEDVLTQLEQKRQALEREKTETDRLLLRREEDARKAREFREQMERAKDNARSRGEAEAKRILQDAKDAADAAFRELDALKKAQKKLEAQQINDARAKILRDLNAARAAAGARDGVKEPIPKPSRPIAAGDLVEIPGTGRQAEVLAVSGGTLECRAGALRMKVKADEVRLIEDDERAALRRKPAPAGGVSRMTRAASAPRELDIRGMETLEAESVVENYLDAAVLARLETVTIIHGKGTGALRKAVHALLRRSKHVKSFRLGAFGEGEAGVTVVELR